MATPNISYDGLRVLLIDDDPYTRQIIRQLLNQLGIRLIAEATDGAAGLTELMKTHPDVVICDVQMRPMDGQEFLAKVRNSSVSWMNKLPVIFLTGDAQAQTVAFAKEHEVDSYIVKPTNAADLKRRIDAVLLRRALKT